MDEGALARWLSLESAKLRESLVASPRSLADLLAEDAPSVATRGGAAWAFDRDALARFATALGALDRRRLRLPISVFVEHEAPLDAYVSDEVAVSLLRALGEIPAEQSAREGRLWLGHARWRGIASRYPGAFQFVHL